MIRYNRFLVHTLTSLFALLLTGDALSNEVLVPHVAEYKVKISVLGGTMRTQVFDVGDAYMARSVISPTGFASMFMDGSIVEQSEFVVVEDVLRPRHYESIDTLSKEKTTISFDFDWQDRKVTGVINEQDFAFTIGGLLHDRVSIQYQLMQNLRNGKDAGQYAMLDGDELKRLKVTNIGTRRIKVPFGRFDAVGIQHQADDSSRVSTLWCVRELGYLPIVIEQHKDGKLRVQAVLTDYRELPAATDVNAAK